MELTRNQWFMLGLVVLFIGIQFRVVESFVLNPSATQFITERMKASGMVSAGSAAMSAFGPSRRVVKPPEWIGWAIISFGSVLILHSLALKRD